MNQVPLNIDFSQILLHLFNVVILFAILYFLIYKPVRNFMEKRKEEYQRMEEEANGKVKEAEDLKRSYEEKLSKAEEEIHSMKEDASREMTEKAGEIRQQAMEEAQTILNRTKAQAEHEKEKILEETGEEVANIAKEAASRAIFQNPSEAYDSFLKAAEKTMDQEQAPDEGRKL